jgi:hypothetical protein
MGSGCSIPAWWWAAPTGRRRSQLDQGDGRVVPSDRRTARHAVQRGSDGHDPIDNQGHRAVHVAGGQAEQHRDAVPQLPVRRAEPGLRVQGVHHHRPAGRHRWDPGPGHSRLRGLDAVQGGLHPACGRHGRLGPGDRVGEHHRQHRRAAAGLQHRLPRHRQAPHRPPGPSGPYLRRARQRGMAKAVVAALRDAGFHTGAVVARNARTGTALADQYGYTWRAEVGSSRPQLLVNATPVGMLGGPAADALPVAPEVVDAAETVFDVVALPALTPLVRRARAQGKQLITGAEAIGLQALEQFVLYTGVRPQRRSGPARLRVLPRIGRHRELPNGPARLHVAISGPPGGEETVFGDGRGSLPRRRPAELRATQWLRRAGSR